VASTVRGWRRPSGGVYRPEASTVRWLLNLRDLEPSPDRLAYAYRYIYAFYTHRQFKHALTLSIFHSGVYRLVLFTLSRTDRPLVHQAVRIHQGRRKALKAPNSNRRSARLSFRRPPALDLVLPHLCPNCAPTVKPFERLICPKSRSRKGYRSITAPSTILKTPLQARACSASSKGP
jgi:hypothetical protein